jgi:methylmalonyl-CoA mutase
MTFIKQNQANFLFICCVNQKQDQTLNPINMNFFQEFSPANRDEWTQEALKVIKQASLEVLQTPTYEGIKLQPFYTAEDFSPSDLSAEDFASAGNWLNQEFVQLSDNQAIKSLIQEAIAKGAEALHLDISANQNPDYQAIRQNIPPGLPLKLRVAQLSPSFWQDFQAYPSPISLDCDFLANWTTVGKLDESNWQSLSEVLQSLDNQAFSRNLQIRTTQFVDAGANAAQELALGWAMAIEYTHQLTDQGISAEKVFAQMEFCPAIGSHFFMEIAKFRAWRILGKIIQSAYKVSSLPIKLHARPSHWNKTQTDIYNNLLRATTEAMSAVIGGVDALTILPYNALFKSSDDFARRIARNISTILKEESHLNKVIDVAAGSYYVENLSQTLVQSAWAYLQKIEQQGGFIGAFRSGYIQTEIEKIAQLKLDNFAQQKDILVGTNKYQNKNEQVINLPSEQKASISEVKLLNIRRLSEEIEKQLSTQ